jgi:hypothetical protein
LRFTALQAPQRGLGEERARLRRPLGEVEVAAARVPRAHRLGDALAEAAAAAQGPEQLGLVVAVGPHDAAVRGDDLDREHAVGREAVAPAEPAQAAAERVADDPDVGRGARERGEPVLGRRAGDLGPEDAGAGAGAAARDVDLDLAQRGRLQQHGVLERRDRGRVVAGALRGDAQAALAGEVDDGHHVGDGGGRRDQRGPLVDREVPRATRLVVGVVPGRGDRPLHARPQTGDVHGRRVVHQHPFNPAGFSIRDGSDAFRGGVPTHPG